MAQKEGNLNMLQRKSKNYENAVLETWRFRGMDFLFTK